MTRSQLANKGWQYRHPLSKYDCTSLTNFRNLQMEFHRSNGFSTSIYTKIWKLCPLQDPSQTSIDDLSSLGCSRNVIKTLHAMCQSNWNFTFNLESETLSFTRSIITVIRLCGHLWNVMVILEMSGHKDLQDCQGKDISQGRFLEKILNKILSMIFLF